jgi:hypothetical protein
VHQKQTLMCGLTGINEKGSLFASWTPAAIFQATGQSVFPQWKAANVGRFRLFMITLIWPLAATPFMLVLIVFGLAVALFERVLRQISV